MENRSRVLAVIDEVDPIQVTITLVITLAVTKRGYNIQPDNFLLINGTTMKFYKNLPNRVCYILSVLFSYFF